MSDESDGDDRPVAWAVIGGGVPTAAELAAITVALTPVAAPLTGTADVGTEDRARRVPNWVRAAIVEGVGGRPPASLQDLVQGRFGLGHVGDPLANG